MNKDKKRINKIYTTGTTNFLKDPMVLMFK